MRASKTHESSGELPEHAIKGEHIDDSGVDSSLLRMQPEEELASGARAGKIPPAPGSLMAFWYEISTQSAWSRRSLLLFTREMPVRKLAISITHGRWFGGLVQLVIVTNCVTMMLQDPLSPGTGINAVLAQVEVFFTAFFTAELVLQVVASGLVVPDPNCGRLTEIYTIPDLLRTRLGLWSPAEGKVTIGNLGEHRMSIGRIRDIIRPFYIDDGRTGALAALSEISTALRQEESVSKRVRALARRAGHYLPVRHRERFLTACACLDWLEDLRADAQQLVESSTQHISLSEALAIAAMDSANARSASSQVLLRKRLRHFARSFYRDVFSEDDDRVQALHSLRQYEDTFVEGGASAGVAQFFCSQLTARLLSAVEQRSRGERDAALLVQLQVLFVGMLRHMLSHAERSLQRRAILPLRVRMAPEYLSVGWNRLDAVVVV